MAQQNLKIVIVGSSNTDLTVRVPHFPLPGETLMGTDFMTAQGGKGANQAVAVARLGGQAVFVARLGDDAFGKATLPLLQAEGMDTSHVLLTPGASSGVALIPVDSKGENNIIVASGANALLSPEDVEAAQADIQSAAILLMQLETPMPTLLRAAQIAHEAGVKVVLNPAPFPPEGVPAELLKLCTLVIPNETEAATMTGVEITDDASALQAIQKMQKMGVQNAIITLGKRGACTINEQGEFKRIDAFKVQAVDTVAAGDTFCGALCVALCKGYPVETAILIGNKASSIAVTRKGAQPSVPREEEVFPKF